MFLDGNAIFTTQVMTIDETRMGPRGSMDTRFH